MACCCILPQSLWILLAGNTLKQHLQSVMPPQLNLSIIAKGAILF